MLEEAKTAFGLVFYRYWPKQRDGFSANYAATAGSAKRIAVPAGWTEGDLLAFLSAGSGSSLPYDNEQTNTYSWVPVAGYVEPDRNGLALVPEKGSAVAYLDGSGAWQDYSFSATVASASASGTFSVVARYRDAKNHLACEFRPDSVVIRALSGGESTAPSSLKASAATASGPAFQKAPAPGLAAAVTATTLAQGAGASASIAALGKAGRVAKTRELVVAGTPYIVIYRVKDNRLEILRIFHGARQWTDKSRK